MNTNETVSNERTIDALDNLRVHQRQLDADGCEVGVSREALNEVILAFGKLNTRARNAEPVVKPLEWKRNSASSLWTGELAFGAYYVAYDEGDGWRAFRRQFMSESDGVEVAFGAKDTVLSAAQADYEQRIRSALYAAPMPAVPDGWVAGLEKALYLAVATQAFAGRDQGTERLERTVDGLVTVAREVDPLIRAMLASASPAPQAETAPDVVGVVALRVLQLIADGYQVTSHGMGTWIKVENPDFTEDNGRDPYIAIDVSSIAALTAAVGGGE